MSFDLLFQNQFIAWQQLRYSTIAYFWSVRLVVLCVHFETWCITQTDRVGVLFNSYHGPSGCVFTLLLVLPIRIIMRIMFVTSLRFDDDGRTQSPTTDKTWGRDPSRWYLLWSWFLVWQSSRVSIHFSSEEASLANNSSCILHQKEDSLIETGRKYIMRKLQLQKQT